MRRQREVPAHHSGAPLDEEAAAAVPDFSADEDQRAALYWRQRADPRSAVHVLHGHGCSLKVKNGDLVCFDTGSERSFPKVTHRLCAIIFLGTSGQITVDAIKWCEAQGVGIYVLGWHGELISATQPSPSANVLLRRAQFAADRVRMAKLILMQKTAGQARIGKLSAKTQRKTLAQIKTARSVDELLIIEAHAALGYWANWRFAVKHKKRNWPDAWTQFTHRASPISGGPRHAMHPVNAMLNYAYSIAAAQITRALAVQGFDPACGFLHADAPGRYSLTYEVMELVRADIDATLLPWIASHTWKRPDFPVTPEGTVRLQPALAAVVAQKAAIPQRDIDRAIEWLADAVRQAA
jgi:CRISPR-associated protein Cas1